MGYARQVGLHGLLIGLTAALGMLGCDGTDHPATIQVQASPGSAVVIPFSSPVKDNKTRAQGAISATPKFSSNPLPHGAELLHSSLSLLGNGKVSGILLVQIPEENPNDIEFALSAHGDGRGTGGRSVNFSTESVEVTITPTGTPLNPTKAPALTGEWTSKDWSWKFEEGEIPALHTRHTTGEAKSVRYRAYSDGSDGWFLIEPKPAGIAYWIRRNGDGTMEVSHPDKAFRPFLQLTRA